ncbi:hypothetical protein JAU75_04415 [Ochrobactrum sp. Q0168]|uniref:glucosyltransferase domain-containing protein n=1 Tax=Ochrobactrum sp. Q0168 TaxID=2793241 RepID=UPI0018ED3A55|nr:hypothetical protein [Ochrobactrum sp. Q0168]
MMNNGKNFYTHLFLSVLFLLSVIWLFLGVFSPDDIYQNTRSATDFSSIQTHWNNFRYFIVLISQPFLKTGIHYNDVFYLWVSSLIIGIFLTCYAVLRYSELPISNLPYFIVLVAVHGYFTNIFYYPMSYSVFGFGFIFIALAILSLMKPGAMWAVVAGILVALSLMSYQPAALIILFAASLSAINKWLRGPIDTSKLFQDVIRAPIAFVLGAALFLLSVKLFSDGHGRAIAPKNLITNLPVYFSALNEILFGITAVNNIYPVIQRLVFLIVNLTTIVALVLHFRKASASGGVMALAALACAFLIFPSPLNLFSDLFWPSPRSISASVFFELGLLFVITGHFKRHLNNRLILLAFSMFIAASAVHQMNVFAGAKSQNLVDQFAAKQILSAINDITPITPETGIAVVSTWKNGAKMNPYVSMDNGLSAFDTTWSNNSVLWLASPVKYKQVPPPAGACANHKEPRFWEIEQRDGVFVVCMR